MMGEIKCGNDDEEFRIDLDSGIKYRNDSGFIIDPDIRVGARE
jgi:hypothetical protein